MVRIYTDPPKPLEPQPQPTTPPPPAKPNDPWGGVNIPPQER